MYALQGDQAIFKGTATTGNPVPIEMINPIRKKRRFARQITVRNVGATNALRVYIPQGETNQAQDFVTVPANTIHTFYGPITRVAVQAAAATTDYEIVALVS